MVKPLMIVAESEPWVAWREGVATRLHSRGAEQLCVLEQRSAPGAGAPTHTHFGAEELIVALGGRAEVWVDGVDGELQAGDSIVLPPGSWHGFRNAGPGELHTLAVFAARLPLVEYEEAPGVVLEIGGSGDARVDAHRAHREGGSS
jgi:quercetin dioxygenase-like cupin family protein